MVLRESTLIAVAGISAGLAGAWGLTHLIASLLYAVKPNDPATFAAASAALIVHRFTRLLDSSAQGGAGRPDAGIAISRSKEANSRQFGCIPFLQANRRCRSSPTMIANPEKTTLVSSMGWVDHDVLWLFDVPAARVERISLGSGAGYLSLHSAGSSRFSVAHHFDSARFELTVHAFSDPGRVQSRAILREDENKLAGDVSAWGDVPLLYVAYLRFEPWKGFVLLRICPQDSMIQVQRFGWYDDTYDKGYQGVIGALERTRDSLSCRYSVARY